MSPINVLPYSADDPQFTVEKPIPPLPASVAHTKEKVASCDGTWLGYMDWDGVRFGSSSFSTSLSLSPSLSPPS